MAAPPQRPLQKGSSRWNWMQQAVASVESRLDTILGEEDGPARKPSPAPPTALPPNQDVPTKRDSLEITRSGASTPTNDRLQARLAQAMARKAAGRPESPMLQSESISRPETPAGAVEATADQIVPAAASALDNDHEDSEQLADDAAEPLTVVVSEPPNDAEANLERLPSPLEDPKNDTQRDIRFIEEVAPDAGSARPSADGTPARDSLSGRPSTDSNHAESRNIDSQLDHDKVQQGMTDEINGYIERIDALQAKLKYLTNEAAESAKQAAAVAQNGSSEKVLLEKDEKIALLMQEGQNLSKNEMKHLQTIKNIRQQYSSNSKEHEATKTRADKAERSLRMMEDRARRAEAATKRAEQNLALSLSATDDLQAMKKKRDALNTTLADIKTQLSQAHLRTEAAESKAETEQLEKERRKNANLRNDLTSVRTERELAEEKLQKEIKDLKAAVEREKGHSRVMETEMLGEQAALESRLESFRARAEEASSNNQGDVQAKLLRQIETLQNQHSAASQNWQGIEGSLLARITALEKERDDISARESEGRRKLREATLKTKRTEKESEEAQSRLPELEKSLIAVEEECHRLSRKVKQLETDMEKADQDFEEQKTQAEKDNQKRLEEEKARWTAALQTSRIETPATSLRKSTGLGFDMVSPLDRPVSRRASHLPGHDSFTPPRQHSLASFKGFSNGTILETPSLVTSNDADEYFNNIPPTPVSQSHAASPRTVHDLVSTSTVGAGPSVQLVERMSANVRRLESEKAAARDELSRLSSQRDEARQEVVSLMRELEEKRKIDERLKTLEADHKDLTGRHQTTLELLGEKSEQVEELKADIVDVKQMYRQLADAMGKS